ncbi:YeeE/YedE family protein [Paracoccus benzoatiresistens]|uniref:YeeE/YedE thiosulfate transporter family protein n=1 Tax=Paracoccus benzoatiresistens TaxID=2997341 RepID=A0ABT4J8Z5_9RHOB|nr:YeeE/YedE thiosulfate transporter family protein [Paracoccus sp. EF6]MCZ0963556.1 YeeE/YedE thiosulfate transporter family protein [Paracoccus sp. EF6]
MEIGSETAFTPWASLFGGVLIGLSAVMVMALFGRIAGIAGIAQGALGLPGAAKDRDWRWAFLVGLVLAPLAVMALGGTVAQTVPDNLPGMALAGLLVGTGTAIGSGCTSGHGVCGLARLSGRSLAAVATFMAAGFATVFVLRHILGGA